MSNKRELDNKYLQMLQDGVDAKVVVLKMTKVIESNKVYEAMTDSLIAAIIASDDITLKVWTDNFLKELQK